MRCAADGRPKPNVEWRKYDGSPIPVGSWQGMRLLINQIIDNWGNNFMRGLFGKRIKKKIFFFVDREREWKMLFLWSCNTGIPVVIITILTFLLEKVLKGKHSIRGWEDGMNELGFLICFNSRAYTNSIFRVKVLSAGQREYCAAREIHLLTQMALQNLGSYHQICPSTAIQGSVASQFLIPRKHVLTFSWHFPNTS